MSFFIDFLHQEVPKSGQKMPAYYRKALRVSEAILTLYYLLGVSTYILTVGNISWPSIAVLIGSLFAFLNIDRMSARVNLAVVTALIGVWFGWFVHMFGWSAGIPNILVPILSLAFFNIYETPRCKLAYCFGLIAFRVLVFAYSLRHTPLHTLDHAANLVLQIVNSVVPLLILTLEFILFSSSIQASERELTINNQALHREAGTDPLTGLPNRRTLLDAVEAYRRSQPDMSFGIALADIDFFKRVNDTYGHNCGDYTLQELAKLFQTYAEGKYYVCRWGGEEFCFFLPGMNLDQAGGAMEKLHTAVRKMPLHFGDIDFSITITIGVEEYDFQSPTKDIVDRADRKLYMGKVHGRDQVVI